MQRSSRGRGARAGRRETGVAVGDRGGDEDAVSEGVEAGIGFGADSDSAAAAAARGGVLLND